MRTSNVLLACFLTAEICLAQQPPPPPHIVTASGEATVAAKPDRAQISFSIETDAPNAANAVSSNASRTTDVIAALEKLISNKGRVTTSGYSLTPDLVYPRDGGTPKTTGYKAVNTVMGTIDDLSLAGKAIDAASAAGANAISGIAFQLKDDEPYRLQALSAAATQARVHAEAVAKALGVQAVGVVEAHVMDGAMVQPLGQPRMLAMAKAPSTPVAEGTVDVHARVEVSLEVR